MLLSTRLWLLFCVGFLAVFMAISLVAVRGHAEEAPPTNTFYQWTDADGTINATDNPERLPGRYTVVKRDFKDIKDRKTPVLVQPVKHTFPAPMEEVNPNRASECGRPVAVRAERRQVGRYNRTYYIAVDECGNEIYNTPMPINLRLNR